MAAKPNDRTGAQQLNDFVRQQREAANYDAWFRREIQAGIDSANAGDLVSAEEVEADAAAWRESTRQRIKS